MAQTSPTLRVAGRRIPLTRARGEVARPPADKRAILARMDCDRPRPPPQPPRHPVYGALGARPEETLVELGLRREDIPWRGIIVCPTRRDLFD